MVWIMCVYSVIRNSWFLLSVIPFLVHVQLCTFIYFCVGNKTNTGSVSSLQKVIQLTGFADPVYAEAYVNVNQYDISLDVLIVNQTDDMLQV